MARKAAKTKTPAEKAADFKRKAEKCVNGILRQFTLLGRLGNANKYASTPKQHKEIAEAISAGGDAAIAAMQGKATAGSFGLSD